MELLMYIHNMTTPQVHTDRHATYNTTTSTFLALSEPAVKTSS